MEITNFKAADAETELRIISGELVLTTAGVDSALTCAELNKAGLIGDEYTPDLEFFGLDFIDVGEGVIAENRYHLFSQKAVDYFKNRKDSWFMAASLPEDAIPFFTK